MHWGIQAAKSEVSVASTTVPTTATTTTPTRTTPAPSTTQATTAPSGPANLNGVWAFAIKVTEAYGACSGEAGGPADSRQITITQTGQNITLTGFLGNPANKLSGNITFEAGLWTVNVSGSYPEDGGTTTSSHRLVVKDASSISGDESWEWTGPGGTCPGGKASVTATRISGH
jgi:hypothetical protein